MLVILRSAEFDAWLSALADAKGKARILGRLRSAAFGNFGDCHVVGEGVSEMRVHVGPGYRVYFTRTEANRLFPADRRRQIHAIEGYRARQAHGPRNPGGQAMTKTYAPFDAAAYLDSDEVIAEYLSAAAEDPNPEVFLAALGDVAKARGMAQIARDAGRGAKACTRL